MTHPPSNAACARPLPGEPAKASWKSVISSWLSCVTAPSGSGSSAAQPTCCDRMPWCQDVTTGMIPKQGVKLTI